MAVLVAQRHPHREQWDILKRHDDARSQCSMEPDEFLKHWNVTYAELAEIVGKSPGHVGHWFSKGKSHKPPSENDRRRLAEVHYIWTNYENDPQYLREIWGRTRQRRKA